MKVLPVDLSELQIALESRDEGFSLHAYWFDVETGEVILLTEDLGEQDELREQIEVNAGRRFVRIEPTDSREAFEVMEDFVRSLRPTRMREKLEYALGGRKPFRRFKDTLGEDAIIREQWFKFEEAATLRQAIEWLAEIGIQPLNSGPVKDDVVDDDLDGSRQSELTELIRNEEPSMSKPEPSPREMARSFTPQLTALVDNPLFSDVWADPTLSPRDRSIATVAALVALYRPEQLPAHLRRACDNGVTRDELAALITHVAFYAGFPAAISASAIAARTLTEAGTKE